MNDSAAMQGQGVVSREKYWEEMNDTEKLNWLKRNHDFLKGRVDFQSKAVHSLSEHSHGTNGALVIPLRNVY